MNELITFNFGIPKEYIVIHQFRMDFERGLPDYVDSTILIFVVVSEIFSTNWFAEDYNLVCQLYNLNENEPIKINNLTICLAAEPIPGEFTAEIKISAIIQSVRFQRKSNREIASWRPTSLEY